MFVHFSDQPRSRVEMCIVFRYIVKQNLSSVVTVRSSSASFACDFKNWCRGKGAGFYPNVSLRVCACACSYVCVCVCACTLYVCVCVCVLDIIYRYMFYCYVQQLLHTPDVVVVRPLWTEHDLCIIYFIIIYIIYYITSSLSIFLTLVIIDISFMVMGQHHCSLHADYYQSCLHGRFVVVFEMDLNVNPYLHRKLSKKDSLFCSLMVIMNILSASSRAPGENPLTVTTSLQYLYHILDEVKIYRPDVMESKPLALQH